MLTIGESKWRVYKTLYNTKVICVILVTLLFETISCKIHYNCLHKRSKVNLILAFCLLFSYLSHYITGQLICLVHFCIQCSSQRCSITIWGMQKEMISAMKFWSYCSLPFRISRITYLGISWRVLFWANPVNHCMISSSFPDQMVLVPHLGNISPGRHSRRHCLSRRSGCVGTNQWPTPFKIHNWKPDIFVVSPWSLFRYHQSLFENGGHLLRMFC